MSGPKYFCSSLYDSVVDKLDEPLAPDLIMRPEVEFCLRTTLSISVSALRAWSQMQIVPKRRFVIARKERLSCCPSLYKFLNPSRLSEGFKIVLSTLSALY